MIAKATPSVFFVLLLTVAANAQSFVPWYERVERVVPLQTTRAGVEESFIGFDVKRVIDQPGYRTVFYSDGISHFTANYVLGDARPFGIGASCPDCVLSLIFFPGTNTPLAKLKLRLEHYPRLDDDPADRLRNKLGTIEVGILGKRVGYIEIAAPGLLDELA